MSKDFSEQQHEFSKLTLAIHDFTSVRRYSNKTLIKDENIAEHSAVVGIIIVYLYGLLNPEDKLTINLDKTLANTIFHDFDEIFTGDILNPVKYYHPSIREKVGEYAEICVKEYADSLKSPLLIDYINLSALNDYERYLLKLSDVISVFIKFRIENQLGNHLIDLDYSNIKTYLETCDRLFNSPKLDLFLQFISDACSEMNTYHKFPNSNILERNQS